jgi:hypothetical protein
MYHMHKFIILAGVACRCRCVRGIGLWGGTDRQCAFLCARGQVARHAGQLLRVRNMLLRL